MSSTPSPAPPPIGNFDQPVLAIEDPQAFSAVHSAVEAAFSSSRVADFLGSLARKSARVRDFEAVLNKGLLTEKARTDYAQLGNADQGQIREYYLASLERVAPELRNKYFKLYAYY